MGKVPKKTILTLHVTPLATKIAMGIILALLAIILGCFAFYMNAAIVIPILIVAELAHKLGQLQIYLEIHEFIKQNNS